MLGSLNREDRAGYWRRTLGGGVDWLIVGIPFSILAVAVFSATGGAWQSTSPVFNFTQCQDVTPIPKDLTPPPPTDSNFARVCDVSSFVGRTARNLVVGRTETSPHETSTVSRDYGLDASSRLVDTHDVGWVFYLLILVYTVILQHRSGQTLGQRVTGTRLVEAAHPARCGVDLKRLAIRYAVLIGGYLLPVAFLLFAIDDAVSADGVSPIWIFAMLVAGIVWFAWSLWNFVLIVRRSPAVYDRFAGLEVIRLNPPTGPRAQA